jgi:hypothetical protein
VKRNGAEHLDAARPAAGGEVVTDDGEVRSESIFRASWRDHHSAGSRPGELIKNPGWIDVGLVALAMLLTAGTIAAGTVTVAQTTTLPAVVQGATLTADLAETPPPAPGTEVQFRDASGSTVDAVIVGATATEVTAQLERPAPASTGELLVPAKRQRLISVFLPRFS